MTSRVLLFSHLATALSGSLAAFISRWSLPLYSFRVIVPNCRSDSGTGLGSWRCAGRVGLVVFWGEEEENHHSASVTSCCIFTESCLEFSCFGDCLCGRKLPKQWLLCERVPLWWDCCWWWGGGQGLVERSHFIRQGSPFAPPPIHPSSLLPPSPSLSQLVSLPAHSWSCSGWAELNVEQRCDSVWMTPHFQDWSVMSSSVFPRYHSVSVLR